MGHEDLLKMQEMGLCSKELRSTADNTLKPGAPVYLWWTNTGIGYSSTLWSLEEFLSPDIEDWVAAADAVNPPPHELPFRDNSSRTGQREDFSPPVPKALTRLAWETDQMRKRSEE